MRIKQEIIALMRKNDDLKLRLKKSLRKSLSMSTVNRWTYENEDNGPLTTAAALHIISEELKVEKNEILEGEVVPL